MQLLCTLRVTWIMILLLQILEFKPTYTLNSTNLQTVILTKITRITKRSLPTADDPDMLAFKEGGSNSISTNLLSNYNGIKNSKHEGKKKTFPRLRISGLNWLLPQKVYPKAPTRGN